MHGTPSVLLRALAACGDPRCLAGRVLVRDRSKWHAAALAVLGWGRWTLRKDALSDGREMGFG